MSSLLGGVSGWSRQEKGADVDAPVDLFDRLDIKVLDGLVAVLGAVVALLGAVVALLGDDVTMIT